MIVFLMILTNIILLELIRFLPLNLRLDLLIFIVKIIRLWTLQTDINRLNKLTHRWLFCIYRRRKSWFSRNKLFFIQISGITVLIFFNFDFFFCKLLIVFNLLFRTFLFIMQLIKPAIVITKYFWWLFTIQISSASLFYFFLTFFLRFFILQLFTLLFH